MGFGKLSDLFFGSGAMAGVNSSVRLKFVFVYGLLGIIPMVFLAVSITQEFAASKIVVLVLLFLLLLYSGTRRKPQ
jgi:Ca2+/Na+ antiporter